MLKKPNNDIGKLDKITSNSILELLEAFKKEGCSICRLNYLNVNSYFSSILYESVNDPTVRRNLRNSLGYCKEHTVQFIQFVESSYNRFGATIMIEDVTRELIKKLKKLSNLSLKEINKISTANFNCPACIYQKKHEDIYYSEIVNNLDNGDFFKQFLESDGLCFNHLLGLLKIVKNNKFRNIMIEKQELELTTIIKDLNAFVKKHTYQGKGEISLCEANAFKKALRKIVGD